MNQIDNVEIKIITSVKELGVSWLLLSIMNVKTHMEPEELHAMQGSKNEH